MLSKKILCSVIEKENYLSFLEKKNFLFFFFPFSGKEKKLSFFSRKKKIFLFLSFFLTLEKYLSFSFFPKKKVFFLSREKVFFLAHPWCKLDILVKLKLDILSNWNIYLVCHLTSLLFYTRYSSQTFIPVFCLRFNQMTFTEKIYVIWVRKVKLTTEIMPT